MREISKFVIGCVMLLLFQSNLQASSIDFYKGNMKEAKTKALKEGKLFFVDFYADWCAPCKWMDETTFSDQGITSMLNSNYVSLKVNIDEFEGFSLKQQYKIKYLPTILIFNAEGELIDRIEETLSPRQMLVILDKHHQKNNAKPQYKKFNTSPSQQNKALSEAYDNLPENESGQYRVNLWIDFS